MLGKMLRLGGMENSLPKTDQTPNRFRVARNVQPSTNGKLIPRSSYDTAGSQPTGITKYTHLTSYDNSIFKMASSSVPSYDYYLDTTFIPRPAFQGGNISFGNDNTSLSVMSFRKNNTLYALNGNVGAFIKYDGVEVTGCGTPMPYFSCAQYDSTGTKWIKVIQHRIDFDNNEPASESVTFPVLNGTASITLRVDGGATNIVNTSNTNIYPSNYVTSDDNNTDDLYFIGTVAYNAGNNDFTVTTSDTNIASAYQIGGYVFLKDNITQSDGGKRIFPWVVNSENNRALALKVKSVSPLVLDGNDAKRLEPGTNTWVTFDVDAPLGAGIASVVEAGFRKILSVWTSSALTGDYFLQGVYPAFPESSTSITYTIAVGSPTVSWYGSTATLIILAAPILADWYDPNTRKLCLNTAFNFGSEVPFQGMTSYQDQILWWNDDLIYFSDPTLGGSVEHPSASSFIRVGDSEYGKVVSCCGVQDFFVVSREKKNYIVNGNLSTGNYRVQDIAEIEIGAWCNNGTINVKNSVVLINAIGVWVINSGGSVSNIANKISQNFSIYDGFTLTDDVAFKIQGYTTFPITVPYVDTGLDIAFDEYREFLVFCQRATANTPTLVLHTKTGEFYEWSGLDAVELRSITFNKGVMYFGTVDESTNLAVVKSELSSSTTQDYADISPIKVYSTWLTAGEPSLEKQLLQLKMFGNVYTDSGNSINVVHFKDWNLTKVTNSAYIPDSATQFSHLKRLNSDKVLAASVGFEVVNTGVTFEIESLEVEFNPIQQGVKR